MAHDHEDHDEHDHGKISFRGTEVTDGMIAQLRALHPALAENLESCAKWAQLSEEERKAIPSKQREVEHFSGWTPGFHSDGDRCATCGGTTLPLFTDRFEQGELRYAAFLYNLPVHATAACLEGFAKARRDVSPRGVDRARRELTKDLERPTASMAMFFRHDVLAHPPFALEDWANSVAEANPAGLDKATARDIDRLIRWVHARLYHH